MTDSDRLQRFVFDARAIRGSLVHLDASWRAVLETHVYPASVRGPLGEALAAAALLAATIKFDGSLILQAQGAGPLRTLVAQASSNRTIRGVARWSGEVPETGDLAERFGEGRLVLTIEQRVGEPYQGIVPLVGCSIGAAIEHYFAQSEQLPTRLWLAATDQRAAGLMIQRLPPQGQEAPNDGGQDDDWLRLGLIGDTLSGAELTGLEAEVLLHRLYHEDPVRLFEPEPMAFRCGCSKARVQDMLLALGESESMGLIEERGAIEVTCEFCNRAYRLDAVDASQLFAETTRHSTPAAQH